MEDAIVYKLSALGFGSFFEEQLSRSEHPASIPARIAAEHRGEYVVWSASGTGRAQLAGKLRTQLEDKGLPAVGDWVILKDETGPDRITIIDHMLARRTVFSRGAAGREGRTQVVAANVDLVFAVCGLDADFNEIVDLSADRLEHYRKLVLEAQACERRHNERLRRQSERVWGQLYDEAARLRRWKGGLDR